MLKIEHLTKIYDHSNKGIKDLSLELKPGDLFAFIGHNGAGKTTTLKSVVGIHKFDSGRILIDGKDLSEDPNGCKSVMAYVPDNPDIFDYLSGIEYLNFIADVFNLSSDLRKTRIEYYADCFEIKDALANLISSYSHGMKQKLVIIAALIHEPKLLILDEPFVGLDPKAIFKLKEIMQAICKRGGAVFFSTHILEVAEKLCNKVAMVKEGKLIFALDMDDALKQGKSLEDIFLEVENNA